MDIVETDAGRAIPATAPFAAHRISVLALALWVGACALIAAGLAMLWLSGATLHDLIRGGHADAPFIAVIAGFLSVLIVQRRPRNPVGWLGLANALANATHFAANAYGVLALVHTQNSLPGGYFVSWLVTLPLPLAATTLVLQLLLFPAGRPVSAAWRWVVYLACATMAVAVLSIGVATWGRQGGGLLDGAPAASFGVLDAVSNATRLLLAAIGIASVGSLFLRYRRADGIERQQVKVLAYGFGIGGVGLLVGKAIGGDVGGWLEALSPLLPAAALYVAMRRYHLYDIDRVISRSVSYAVLTIVLGAVYLGAATVFAWALAPLSGGSSLVIAASAVGTAALFQPLRRRLQDLCDRTFSRASHDAGRLMDGYLRSLQEHEPGAGALRVAAAEALRDPTVEVGLWIQSTGTYVDETGAPLDLAPRLGRVVTPIDRHGQRLGVFVHEAMATAARPELLVATVGRAAPAMDHARLRAQVAIQLAEVRASRARIVAAGDSERRRMERDLHDGAQQRLLAAAISLRRLEAHAPRSPSSDDDAHTLAKTAEDVEAALLELRELTHGLVPPILADLGLEAAIQSLAERTPMAVLVDCTDPLVRYPQATELAAYFVVSESLANAVKHARARRAGVSIRNLGDTVEVEVNDDGQGGATMAGGSGLMGLRDRVEAIDGTLTVDSPPGQGTRITAVLPAR